LEINNLAVLWDMDGTILDTFDLHYETWQETFAGQDIPFNRDLFRSHFGANNRETVPIYLGYEPDESTYTEIANYKEELFRQQLATKARLFPGVTDWFTYFANHGAKQAIASSANMENIEKVVDAFRIRHYFGALVSGEDLPSKPAPDIFLRAAIKLGVPPEECVVFEDSFHGVNSAKAAGMVSVGFASTAHFKPGDADIILHTYAQNPAPIIQHILHLIETRKLTQR
jgi:HAD superfamily hydrolase (TIGR01509 family)